MPLYITATPIGNLKDLSERALETLKNADLILAEDTRRARALLAAYKISAKIERFDQNIEEFRIEAVMRLLKDGKNIALVSDAGTPGISDPGAKLVRAVYEKLPGTLIVPIPGASAVTAALSVCGFPTHEFLYLGYPPRKPKKRRAFFERIAAYPNTVIFFSTPYDILKDLTALKECGLEARQVCVGREMTKVFETFYRGAIEDVILQIKNSPLKGEFTVVVGNYTQKPSRVAPSHSGRLGDEAAAHD